MRSRSSVFYALPLTLTDMKNGHARQSRARAPSTAQMSGAHLSFAATIIMNGTETKRYTSVTEIHILLSAAKRFSLINSNIAFLKNTQKPKLRLKLVHIFNGAMTEKGTFFPNVERNENGKKEILNKTQSLSQYYDP